MSKTKHTPRGSIVQQQKKAAIDRRRSKEKFYAWLGEVLSTGMTPEDFHKAQELHKQGVSVEAMQAGLKRKYQP